MKKIIIYITLFIFCCTVSAQKKIKIWESAEKTHQEKWSKLFVFLPEKQDSSGISVIVCPGGSYYWLDMANEGFSVARYLNKKGITAFVLKYRTAKRGNHHPAMIQDLERAMQLVKANSCEYAINPEKIGILGFSAGGHLAGTTAIHADMRCETQENLKPYFAAMIYPVVSMQDSICHKKSRKNLLGNHYDDRLKQMMSLENHVHADTPPIFLLHCTGDKTVDYRNSVVFAKALTESHVKHQFLLIEENGHGFGIKPNGKATGWIEEFVNFIFTATD